MLEDRLLDEPRSHLEAAGVDQVVDPPVDAEPGVVVGAADVVGAEPPDAVLVGSERRRGEVGRPR